MSSSSAPSTVAKPKSETLTFRLSSSRIFSGWRKIFEHQLTIRFSNAKCPLHNKNKKCCCCFFFKTTTPIEII